MRIKKLLSFAVAAAMTISALCGAMSITAFAAEEEEVSNSCGDGVVWEYDTATTTLKISYTGEGTGAMTDYEDLTKTPWSAYQNRMTTVVIGEGVTHIGANAIVNSLNLTSLSLPNTLKSIGNGGLQSLRLKTIELPGSLEVIGDNAFYASQLTEITMPSSVKSIGKEAFRKCSSLTTVNFNDGLKTIGEGAFQECTKIGPAVTIPGTVETIGANAFYQCQAITDLTFNEGSVKTDVGATAFQRCSKLKTVSISSNVNSIGDSAFDRCALQTVTIAKPAAEGSGLTTLGNSVFLDADSITAIELPDTITTMGTDVFSGCTKLDTVNIPTGLTTIPNKTFYNCRALTEITIGTQIKSIGISAFENCRGLEAITIPKNVETIGDKAFMGCSGAKTITLPTSGLTTLGNSVFENCSNTELTTIKFPNSITSMGGSVLSGCKGIVNVTLPSQLKEIPGSMFNGCTDLEPLDLSKYTSIGGSAFKGCKKFVNITIPSTMKKVGDSAFQNCTALETVTVEPGGITEIANSTFSGDTALNSVTLPYDVKTIGMKAFEKCSALHNIMLPSVQTIGNSAFSNSGLESIMIPSETIDTMAFQNCKSLANVTFGDSVKVIEQNAFNGCEALKSITLPKNLESLNPSAFRKCTALTAINAPEGSADYSSSDGVLFNADKSALVLYPAGKTSTSYKIPNSVKTIKTYAFYQASMLTSVTIPSTVETFETYAFSESGLKTLDIPEGITSIGDPNAAAYTFSSCKSLTTVTIPGTVKALAGCAFYGCSQLQTVNLSEGTENLSDLGKTFYNCSALVNINIPSTVNEMGSSTFYGCSSLKSIKIPEGVTTLGYQLFYNCSQLTDVDLPTSLTELGSFTRLGLSSGEVFRGCTSLESIVIPENVTKVCEGNFNGCTGLKSVVLPPSITTIPNNTFYNCNNADLKIYILGVIDPKITATNTFNKVKGKVYVYNQLTKDNLSTVVKSPAELVMPVDFTELQGYIAQAKALVGSDYTVNSYSLVVANMVMAERVTVNKDATPEDVKTATSSLKKAINGLVEADNSDAYAKLQEVIEYADSLNRKDYSVITYSNLFSAVIAGKAVSQEALISEIDKARENIETALDNLLIAYLDSAASIEKYIYHGDVGEDGYGYTEDDGDTNSTVIASGVADEALAGATQIKFTFSCASDVSWNPNSYLNIKAVIAGVESEDEYIGTDTDYTLGTRGWTVTLSLENPIEVGDEYEIIGWTMSWEGKPDDAYVFEITRVELLDEEGNLVGVVGIEPKAGIEAAIEKAEALDTSMYTDESVKTLQDALAAAKALDEVVYPLPSEIEAVLSALNEALDGMKTKDADYSDVDAALAKVPSDLTKYTNETVKALQDAINAVQKGLGADKQSTVDGYAKAINDAVKNLKEKSATPPNSNPSNNNNNNNNNGGNTNVNKPNSAATTAKKPDASVNKAKNDATKVVNKAKITKLKVKSKAKKKITVTWKKVKGVKGYEVQVSSNSKFKKSKIILKKKNVKKLKVILKSKKFKSGKTYYVRVRAFATYKDSKGVTKRVNSSWNKKLRKVKVK